MLSDQVWWYNIKQFLSYHKNYICKFLKANSWHQKIFYFHLSFWIWKVWKEREKTQKFEYLQNKKTFLDKTNNIFHSFLKGNHLLKNKNLIKNSRHILNSANGILAKLWYYVTAYILKTIYYGKASLKLRLNKSN